MTEIVDPNENEGKVVVFLRKRHNCRVCKHPQGIDLSAKFLNHEVTSKQAAEQIGCHWQTFYRHIQMCTIPALEQDPLAAPELKININKVQILEEIITRLYARAQLLLDQELDPKQEGAIRNITSELRGCIETLAKLTNELKGDVTINIGYEMDVFRRAAEQILLEGDPETWRRIRTKMEEIVASEKGSNTPVASVV